MRAACEPGVAGLARASEQYGQYRPQYQYGHYGEYRARARLGYRFLLLVGNRMGQGQASRYVCGLFS